MVIVSWTEEQLFSSKKHDWETPQPLFDALNEEFHFGLDVASSEHNAKCSRFFTADDVALMQDWGGHGSVWCNPPYGRGIGDWIQKCALEGQRTTVVALVFARTDTQWFHDWIVPHAYEVRFIKGRLRFSRGGDVGGPAPAPSMIVIWNPLPENDLRVRAREQP